MDPEARAGLPGTLTAATKALDRLAAFTSSDAGSGPRVAWLFHRLLALVSLVAFGSLLAQIDVLIGSRGLLPIAPFVERLRGTGVGYLEFPSLFLAGASDGALRAGLVAGLALSGLALAGVAPRVCFAGCLALYVSYATACRSFTSFQWDNLLLEALTLTLFLPTTRRSRLAHIALRLLLFKLYFESGLAKWGSYLHDWRDGSAMQVYYETAPLPAGLAWYAHHLPAWFHSVESRAVLVLELLVPFAIFGPRSARRIAFIAFTAFQLVNALTANYGFFCYLSAALHVLLLDESDLIRLDAWVTSWARRSGERWTAALPYARVRLASGAALLALYALFSVLDGFDQFGREGGDGAPLQALRKRLAPFRVVNVYHLFGAITRDRVEAEFQTFDGATWSPQYVRWKPGPLALRPPYVAPYQPRVAFQLWFYGLMSHVQSPPYVSALLDRLCAEPDAVEGLFRGPLPPHPEAVRVAFFSYRFTSADERAATGAYWRREPKGAGAVQRCASVDRTR